jgi:Leucine-rich repeat (LRR) protein
LPENLSNWHSIANLNLSNIQIENFEKAVRSLATLPSLKSLYINLFEEEQVDLIMRYLPDLEFLNGLPVDREALNESV